MNMNYDKNKMTVPEEYIKFFNKNPGARVVESRYPKKLSDYLDFSEIRGDVRIDERCYCLNDSNSIVRKIRENEKDFVVLDEGLVKTYPTKKVISYLRNVYDSNCDKDFESEFKAALKSYSVKKEYPQFYMSDPREEVSPLMMVSFFAKDDDDAKRMIKIFTDKLSVTGYFLSTYDISGGWRLPFENEYKCVSLQIEAKYSDMTAEITDVLYHVSPLKNLKKIIARGGLLPMSKSKSFDYPDRIYMFNKCDQETIYNYARDKANDTRDSGFCVFKIRKDKLLNWPAFKSGKQRLYLDPNFSLGDETDNTAVFTYGNIPIRLLEPEYAEVRFDDNSGNMLEHTVIKKLY